MSYNRFFFKKIALNIVGEIKMDYDVLVLTNKPDRASYRQRIGLYMPYLSEEGFGFSVFNPKSNFRDIISKISKISKADIVFIQKQRFKKIDRIILKLFAKKIVYDFDDAVVYDDKRPNDFLRSRETRFKKAIQLADKIIAGNTYLADLAKKYNSNVSILPTGLELANYKYLDEGRDNNITLVWIGSQGTIDYLRKLKPVFETIGKKYQNVKLRIICNCFFDLDNMQVEKCEWSVENQACFLGTSDVGLAPLPDNPFTRGKCGFKILQYQASRLPVVTSPIGVNAEYVKDGVNGFHATSEDDWVEKLSILIEDEKLRKTMGDAGLIYVKDFDIKKLSGSMSVLLKSN